MEKGSETSIEMNGTHAIVAVCEKDDKDEKGSKDDRNLCTRYVERIELSVGAFLSKNRTYIRRGVLLFTLCLFLTYVVYCMNYKFGDEGSIVLLVLTILILMKIVSNILRYYEICSKNPDSLENCTSSKRFQVLRKVARYLLYFLAIGILSAYLIIDVFIDNPENVRCLLGIFIAIVVCYIFSTKPSKVNWHPVFWSFIMQFILALLTLRTRAGYETFKWMGDNLQAFLDFSDAGSAFILGANFKTMGLVFSISGMIIFFNSVIVVLTMWGVIEWVIIKMGLSMSWALECGPVESVVAAANIFFGLAEAPLLIRPYVSTVTRSELHAIMTCGYASVSGAFMGMFLQFGVPSNHLLTAAVISAPAALGISKLICPETETVHLGNQKNIRMVDAAQQKQTTVFQAISEGAVTAIPVIASIMVNMLTFISMLTMIDGILSWGGHRAGIEGLSVETLCANILYPLAYVMGVPEEDCGYVGSLLGVKMVATPVVAFQQMGILVQNRLTLEDYQRTATGNDTWYYSGKDIILTATNTTLIGGIVAERTAAIATYALCGLSAFPAIGMSMGALIPICPERKKDVLDLVVRSFIAGNIVCFVTGAVAGVMHSPSTG